MNKKIISGLLALAVSFSGISVFAESAAFETPLQSAKTIATLATPIKGAAITGIKDVSYTGAAIKPKPKVVLGGKTLSAGTDYKLSYKNNTKVGTATVNITGTGNYSGTITKTFKIKAVTLPKEFYGTYITTEVEFDEGVTFTNAALEEFGRTTFTVDKDTFQLDDGNKLPLDAFDATKEDGGYRFSFFSMSGSTAAHIAMTFAKKGGKYTMIFTMTTIKPDDDGEPAAESMKFTTEKK